MLTLGSKYEGDTSARYFGGVFQLQVLFALSTAVLIAIGFEVCVWTGLLDPTIRTVIAPLVCACFCFQMQEFARRALQALRRPLAALQCDVTAYGLQCACMGWLLATHHSDLATILWMLAASWLAGCLFFVTLCNRFVFSFSGLSWAWTTHISFGLALAIGTILQWFGAYGAMYIAAARLSAEAIGNIRGAMNIVAPLNVLAVGLQTFLSIEAAQIYRTEGTAAMSGLLRRSAARFCLTCIPAGIVLSVWARPMVRLLLGVSFRIPALWISIGFTAIVAGALFGFSVIRFKTVERTLPTTYAAGAGLLLTMITTPALIPVLGAGAVFAGWLVGQAGAFACTEWMWRQSRQEWLRG